MGLTPRQDALARAGRLIEAGARDEARSILEGLIAERPDDAEAVSGLGALHLEAGDADAAVECLGAAIALGGERARDYANLGVAHRMAGQAEAAELCFRRALDLDPGFAAARVDLAVLLDETGRGGEARDTLGQGTRHAPASAALWLQASEAARHGGDGVAQLRALGHALALDPGSRDAWNNLGLALGALGHPDDAVACLRIAASRDPRNPVVAANLAQYLLRAGDAAEAERLGRLATVLQPRLFAGHSVLGRAMAAAGRDDEALRSLGVALRLEPRAIDAATGLADVMRKRGDAAAALRAIDWALRAAPDEAALHVERAELLEMLGRYPEAFAALDAPFGRDGAGIPRLLRDVSAEALDGRRVLVLASPDAARTLRLLRYLPRLYARGATVHMAGAEALAPLGGGLGCDAWPALAAADPAGFDAVTPIDRLPHLFQAAGTTVPDAVPYLATGRGEALAARLGGRRRVLWCWRGIDPLPSEALARIRAAALDGDGRLVVLDDDRHEAGTGIVRIGGGPLPPAALGDLLEAADAVVATDEGLIHLAGAMGRPTAAVLGPDLAGSWSASPALTAWYPTVAAFRAGGALTGPLATWLAEAKA